MTVRTDEDERKGRTMNGAESLVRTLVAEGVDVCFANPGTSEMHFVAALDRVPGIRCVLGLFEGVVTGAADGYARMADKPGVTLLHTGPGLANGLANLHNAKKASTAVVNIVGEHATWHIEHDAPLTADIEGLARPVSHWFGTAASASAVAGDGAAAIAAAASAPGRVATLVLPANTAWEDAGTREDAGGDAAPDAEGGAVSGTASAEAPTIVPPERVDAIAALLARGEPVAFVLGGRALRAEALEHGDRVAWASGAMLLAETFKARAERGAGRVAIIEIPYVVDAALALLKPYRHIVTVCAKAPVAFFAYPDKPSALYPPDAELHTLAAMHENGTRALADLARALRAEALQPSVQPRGDFPLPADGPLTPEAINLSVAARLPEQAIVVDESVTSGRDIFGLCGSAAPHDWLEVCGGSIGGGLPLAVGAAIACPARKVITLQADGSGMYTLQALWTQARESLDIVTIIYANRAYEILKYELRNVQAESGEKALDMMELDRPELDWVALARGMGVDAVRADTIAGFDEALARGLATTGPYLIEAVI